jgi:hypothetical protein
MAYARPPSPPPAATTCFVKNWPDCEALDDELWRQLLAAERARNRGKELDNGDVTEYVRLWLDHNHCEY